MVDKKELNEKELDQVAGGMTDPDGAKSSFYDSNENPAFMVGEEVIYIGWTYKKAVVKSVSSKREKQGLIWKNYQFKYEIQLLDSKEKPFTVWEYKLRKKDAALL